MKNIFIEGIQGLGKSTLLQTITEKTSEFRVCREGEYSPVELAWCAWMTEKEYEHVLERYRFIESEIRKKTVKEGEHYIVAYTKIMTDIPDFYETLERFEIYNGRKSLQELEQIILKRYQQFCGTGYLFECSFMQNIVEDLILYHQLNDDEIIRFYHKLYGAIQKENFLLLYLYSDNLEQSTRMIQKERLDNQGKQIWYSVMLEYLTTSPYGKQKGYKDFEDLIAHFRHRQQVELRIIHEVVKEHAVILPAKQWEMEEVLKIIG